MYELHENEQYFFDEETLGHLSEFVSQFQAPCCVCCPLLGQRLSEMGVPVTILDIDERFGKTPGFRHYDIYRPEWLGLEFDLIVCDPPFFNVSLSQLFAAIRILARNDFQQPVLISYLHRRANAILGTFAPFEIRPTGFFPTYQTVQDSEKNRIEFFSNLPETEIRRLSTRSS